MQRKFDFGATLRSAPTLKAAYERHGNRGPGFDTLRLAAATAVVLHHAGSINHDIVKDDILYRFSGGYTHLGILAVSVFFALSGFLVTPGLQKSGDVLEYLSRRFMRIMPLLCVIVVLTVLVVGPLLTTLPLSDYFGSSDTWRYFRNVTTLLSLGLPGVINYEGGEAVNSPLWSLHFEWLCYGILALASLTGLLRKRLAFAALYLAVMGVLVFGYGPQTADANLGRAHLLLSLFSYFGAGVLVFLFRDLIRWSVPLMLLALAALCVTLWLGFGYVFAPMLVTYLIAGVGLLTFPWGRFLEHSDLSYGVYLSHSLALSLLAHWFHFDGWMSLFLAAWAMALAFAWCSWNVIERPALDHKSLPAKLVRRLAQTISLSSTRAARD
jgi:peptidoglycan/LPS O-acetylase OafA/YrhL